MNSTDAAIVRAACDRYKYAAGAPHAVYATYVWPLEKWFKVSGFHSVAELCRKSCLVEQQDKKIHEREIFTLTLRVPR